MVIRATVVDKWFWEYVGDRPILLGQTSDTRPQPLKNEGFVTTDFARGVRVDGALVDRLNAIADSAVSLDGLSVPAPLTLVSWRDYLAAFKATPADPWASFRKRFPGVTMIASVSRPAVASDGRTALISVETFHAAPCCSAGYTAYLEKKDGSWKVVAYGWNWVE